MLLPTEDRLGEQRDVAEFAGFLTAGLGLAVVGSATLSPRFGRFLGDVPPVVALGVAGVAGAVSIRALSSSGWLERGSRRRGLGLAALAASAFGAAIVTADAMLRFARDINEPWPSSLVLYPVMAVIAETFLHLVPLAFVAVAIRRVSGRTGRDRAAAMLGVGSVAGLETVYQVIATAGAPLLRGYLAVHMMAFGTTQLLLLRRFGFASMMTMRLAYYVVWHVVWGHIRLDALF